MNAIVLDKLISSLPNLTARLESIHESAINKVASLDRIACAIYDPKTDLLKTFFNSTIKGSAITNYEFKLSDSQSLKSLSETASCRVVDDVQYSFVPNTEHSRWLLQQNYCSSFTVPMYSGEHFIGFVFFDSFESGAFDPRAQRDLILYVNLITMAISSELIAVNSLMATALAARKFADLRDFETGKHLDRMAQFSRLIGRELAKSHHINDEFIEHLYLFAPLHDIGKIGIPDSVLLKQGRFTQQERELMETHVEKGEEILNKVLNEYDIGHLADSKIMLNIVSCHHEYLDGSGYPRGLKGDQIPIEARIITVADIFDALTSSRPYKEPWNVENALDELERMVESGKLDRSCVAALRGRKEQAQKIVRDLVDEDIKA
ncbi:HD domain-containing protein [Pontibacterium granulatum]|uniref:HD-GYP domain-containing protein n=1 Tax=Pontibacterium granulatum TaxID=2036029 RepID=UPI00249CB8E5|nr:HD domain-containing phosphohydrolase [Pontibacterium granulatum]MDI3326537.1 HD domain-containing protein [Pontibacterium granulatum]